MNDRKNLLVGIVLALLLSVSMLSGCNIAPSNPNQSQIPSDPVIDGGENDPTNPNQDKEPDVTENGNASIMDGEDHIAIPFG